MWMDKNANRDVVGSGGIQTDKVADDESEEIGRHLRCGLVHICHPGDAILRPDTHTMSEQMI